MDIITTLLGALFVAALILLGREIACWYLKINARLDEQKRTNALLVALLQAQGVSSDSLSQAVDDPYEVLERPTGTPALPDSDSAAYKVGRVVGRVTRKNG